MKTTAIQSKLDRLAKLANELDKEAKRRYGPDGMLFFSDDGSFHLMSGDSDHGVVERTAHIKFTSSVYCRMGAGAW